MFSSRFWLATPRFLWRGRWFWGAWLLVFLLPATRHEARLHFIGSRFFSQLYGQPLQERWMGLSDPDSGLPPLEEAVWRRVRAEDGAFSGYSSSPPRNPATTMAGRLLRKFPREEWLRALALQQSLYRNSLGGQSALRKWAQTGERLAPHNALYPLALAKIWGDSRRPSERAAALHRAARCSRFDDGTSGLKIVALRASRKAGVATWDELWRVWSNVTGDGYGGTTTAQLEALQAQFLQLSERDIAANTPARSHALLARSDDLMRVALLLQKAPTNTDIWRVGAEWTRGAWTVTLSPSISRPAPATLAGFEAFARANNDPASIRLARRCAVRVRLLGPFTAPRRSIVQGPLFPQSGWFWADALGPVGCGVLFFGAYLLGWWWFVSAWLWFAGGSHSTRAARVVPALVVIGATAGAFILLTFWVVPWATSPTMGWRGPPVGQTDVGASLGLFWFFAPPLLLALWCAVRTARRNRAVFDLPARQSLEMRLVPVDAFLLNRAPGTFAGLILALSVGFWALWGVLRWKGTSGWDWLRFLCPKVSTRVLDPALTSFDSPFMPIYGAMCAFLLLFAWMGAWRFTPDARRRAVFHEGLRAWKETLGCALTLTVWVYLGLLMVCHNQGITLSKRLDIAAVNGEGAFVKGF